jgi:hypothetical protein
MRRTARENDHSTPRRLVVLGALAVLVAGAGCGGRAASSAPTAATERPVLQSAGRQPSASARMVCGTEGRTEIAATVGVDVKEPPIGQWRNHLYSCTYDYGHGRRMALSVKELSTAAETTSYFDELGVRLGRMRALQGLGEGAYQTSNGSTVVRKDHLVLLVDATKLSASFGTPSSPRADVSLSVAATIMGCWTGE